MNDITIDKNILKEAEALDALRFIACLCVVLFHFNQFAGVEHSDPRFPYFHIIGNIYTYGGWGVEFFFLLSGFTFFAVYEKCITNNKISLIDFCKKRIIRLFPLYYFATIIQIFVVCLSRRLCGTAMGELERVTLSFKQIVLNILGIAGLQRDISPYVAPAWTMGIEILCYLLFYAVCYLIPGSRHRIIACLILSFIVGGGVLCKDIFSSIINDKIAIGLMAFFFGGILLNFQRLIEKHSLNLFAFVGSSVILVLGLVHNKNFITNVNLDYVLFPVLDYVLFPVLILIVLNSTYINRFFKMKLWRLGGKLSFPIYLIHMPIMGAIWLFSKKVYSINFFSKKLLIYYLIIVLIISIFLLFVIEKPLKQLFSKILYKNNLFTNL